MRMEEIARMCVLADKQTYYQRNQKYVLYMKDREVNGMIILKQILIKEKYWTSMEQDRGGPGQRRRYSDLLRPERSGDRIAVRAIFSVPVQTGPGDHTASYTTVTGSFLGVRRPGSGVEHPLPSSSEVKERVELYLYSSSGASWLVLVKFTFTFMEQDRDRCRAFAVTVMKLYIFYE